MEGTIGEIRLWGGQLHHEKMPVGWVECNGQTLEVMKNQAAAAVLARNMTKDTKEFSVPVIDSPWPEAKYIICIEGNFPRFD